MNKLLKGITYGCLIMILTGLLISLPSIQINEFVQSTITSKFIMFSYCCLAILGFFLFHLIRLNKIDLQISKLDILLFVLVGYISLNRFFIQDEVNFSIRYLELLELGLLYIVLRNVSLKSYPWLLLAIVISGIIQAIYGNLQLLGYYSSNHSGFKMTGSYFNPGPFAGFLTSVWGISLGLYLFSTRIVDQVKTALKWKSKLVESIFKYIPLLGIISIALVIPASQSRAAWLGVLFSSLVLYEFKYRLLKKLFKKTTQIKRVIVLILSSVILISGLFGIYYLKKGSSDGRLFIWKVTSKIIKDTPVFGVGFDRFKANYMNYQANYFTENGETSEALVADNTYYAFNEWLQFVAENGFIGALLLLLLLFTLLNIKVKTENKYLFFMLKASLIGIGIFACFSYPMQILPIKLIITFLLAYSARLDINKKELKIFQHGNNKNIKWFLKSIALIVGVVIISKGVLYTKELADGFKNWKIALNTYQYGDYEVSIKKYESEYPIFKEEGEFLMNYGKTLSMANEHTKAIIILEQAKHHLNTTIIETALVDSYKAVKQYKKAEMSCQHAANMIPSRFYPNYLLAKLYDECGQKEKAVAKAQELMKKEVKIPSTAIEEIRVEMKKLIEKYKNDVILSGVNESLMK